MPWRGAEYDGELPSLGWLLLDWWADLLPSPRDENEPLIFTDEQARLLLDWYTIDPQTGRYLYRRGCSRRMKGWGKSPVEAAKTIAEFCGPVRFDGWDANGEPVGRPWGFENDPAPWVQVGAVSEDQTDNTWSVVYYFLVQANGGKAADALRIDAGLTRCFLRDRQGRLEPVTASAGSREGQPITYAVLDETHLWTPRNGGVKLARTLRRNVAKMGGRTYETTNAFVPGEGSVAEGTHKAAERGTAGVFYDAVEAPDVSEDCSDAELAAAIKVARGDAWWVDVARYVADARDPDMPWEDVERFFLNHNKSSQGKAVDSKRWAALAQQREVGKGERVGLGFDGSINEDCTVLIGCTADGHLFVIDVWERPADAGKDWRVPRLEVKAKVRWAFDHYDVGLMLCDEPKWWTEIEEWQGAWPDRVEGVPTNSDARFAPKVDRFLTAVQLGELSHADEPTLTTHVLAAHKRKAKATAPDDDDRTLFTLTKPEDAGRSVKIDAAVGAVLAYEAAMTMPAAEPTREFWGAWA